MQFDNPTLPIMAQRLSENTTNLQPIKKLNTVIWRI